MSQANDELVARAQDPNAPLDTLHQLAQNYPSLRPHIAANPRTYPALLKWLGTLGDPEVDAALAARATSSATSAPSAVSAAATVSAKSAAAAGAAGAGGAQSDGGGEATQAIATQPGGYQPASVPGYQAASAASVAASGPSAVPGSVPASPRPVPVSPRRPMPPMVSPGAPRRVSAAGGAATSAANATVFGVGTEVRTEEKSGGAPSGLFLWILGALVLALLAFTTTWYLTSNNNDPTSGDAGAQGVRTTAAANPESGGAASAAPSAAPSATPTKQIKAPAPEGAIELSSFTSPSGNITCVLSENSVSCTIKEHNFTNAACQSNQNAPFTYSVGEDGQVNGSCAEAFRSTGATLNYGGSAKNDNFACTSADSGISCWNQYTGQGFKLSRSASETFER